MMEKMDELLSALRRYDALRDEDVHERKDKVATRSIPRHLPTWADDHHIERLSPPLRQALHAQGIRRLYSHQAQAIDCICSGQDVVLEAPTASGKTLCFNIPLLQTLVEKPQSHALILHPMKALSNDQRRQFENLAMLVSKRVGSNIESWVFDGDSEAEHRKIIKNAPPSVLFTNPEMLHLSFLQWQDQWLKFLPTLRMVVIDEIHEYRGYFGTNVALLLRRFFASLRQLEVRPQVVLATATCGNAEEHAYRLTGRHCTLVRATTAMRPQRHFAFIEPNIPDFKFHDIYRLRIVRATLSCLAQGLTTLIFCPSRKFAEEAAMRAKSDAENFGINPEVIAPYRSGYEADLRRQIEDGLRDGHYQAVFCTNALELGIDIGRLDACILAGFPDSVLSAWQRIGRVGRGLDKDAYILFYAFNNPFDQFFANNIDVFLHKPLDEILIGVDNEELMTRHLPYLVHETGNAITSSQHLQDELGKPFFTFAKKSVEGTKPVKSHPPNYRRLSIRGGGNTIYKLMYKDKELGTISDTHLFREAYVGAVYNHFGKSYRVTAHGANEVHLEEADPRLRTEGNFFTLIQESEMLSSIRYEECLAASYGRLTVFENFAGYRLIDTETEQVLEEERSQLARSSNVRGFWLEYTNTTNSIDMFSALDLFSFEQLLRIGAPFVVPCDRHDLGTFTSAKTLNSVYLYETVPGGIGVAEKALEVWPQIIRTALEITQKCTCKHGCPGCLVPPRLSGGYDEPKKESAVSVANLFLKMEASPMRERFDVNRHVWVPVSLAQ